MNSTARTEVDSPEGSDICCAPVCPPDKLSADSLHTPLEEAVAEFHRRRADKALCRAVAEFQQSHPPKFLDGDANAFFVRPVFSADLEVERFSALSRKTGLTPLCLEVSKDRFYSFNREKYRRGKLAFRWPNRTRALRVIDFQCNGQRFDEIPSLNGCSLVEFHHRLLAHVHPKLADRVREASDWIFAASQISPRYLHLLSLAITDGILFENFFLDDPEERRFMEERILPSFHRITELFGVKPLIVRLFSPEEENTPVCWEYPGELYPFARDLLNGGGKNQKAPFSWLHPGLKVAADSSRGGQGIFAIREVEKGTLLSVWGGHVMRLEDEPVSLDGRADLPVQIHDDFALGPMFSHEVEDTDSFNHSCSPNAGIHGQIFLVALRDIRAGEQVCFDHAMVLNTPGYRFECRCGAPNCRGTITGEDWKLPELQARYDGYFQWYLQEKIKAARGNFQHSL